MQEYNYAEEIIKEHKNQFAQSLYVRGHFLPGDDIINEQDQNTAVNSEEGNDIFEEEEAAQKKINAYQEGIKNDDINIDENIDAPVVDEDSKVI